MTHIAFLSFWLINNVTFENYLFHLKDLKILFPHMSYETFKTFLNRSVQKKIIERVCHNLYGFQIQKNSKGNLLFHAASSLRSHCFNYISLETVLSDEGIISQVPQKRIFVMTTGRSQWIDCGEYGVIEFVHTKNNVDNILKDLVFDDEKRLWRANVQRAIKDMKKTKRSLDLIQEGI